jgi:GNAT superfamily N-acetyltransferase
MDTVTAERLAYTEYTYLVDPVYRAETGFGWFYHHPDFPDRRDANQLLKCRCREGDVGKLVAHVEALYEPTGLPFRKLSGHDPATFEHLRRPLTQRGWKLYVTWMMVFDRSPERPINPDIEIQAFDATQASLPEVDRLNTEDGSVTSGHRFHRSQDARVGGEWLVGYLDGEPVSSTGWYVVGGVARFRRVMTMPEVQGQGAATTLIRYVQEHPIVREQDALTIHCGEDGPVRLYEQLGFTKRAKMFEFLKLLESG